MKIGDPVYINSCEGFGGLGHIIAMRDSQYSKYRVAMIDGNPPPFWAHDFEVTLGKHSSLTASELATHEHILVVQELLGKIILDLTDRSRKHDASKLQNPEKEIFEEYTPKLANSIYGSGEYNSFLVAMNVALKHHYANNPHHPEYYEDGIKGMSLLDLIEMIADWKAATLRHKNGDIYKSIEINQKRFNYSDELKQIFLNTLKANNY